MLLIGFDDEDYGICIIPAPVSQRSIVPRRGARFHALPLQRTGPLRRRRIEHLLCFALCARFEAYTVRYGRGDKERREHGVAMPILLKN